jgi:hypothetical protein
MTSSKVLIDQARDLWDLCKNEVMILEVRMC